MAEELSVDPEQGLGSDEATRRLANYGANRLSPPAKTSTLSIILDQFKGSVVFLLMAAAGLAFLFGQHLEAWAVLAVLVLNAAIGATTELRAIRSMEALRQMTRTTARIRRDGQATTVASEDLVPGDVVLLEAGDLVPADLRLLEANQVQADESALTGESLPVDKAADPVDEGTGLADRTSMLHQGTVVTRGTCEGLVVATGQTTELGRIAELVEGAEDTTTTLERRLEELGRQLVWAVLVVGVAVTAAGLVQGKDLFLMVETGIALAVAAIPEGLPVVATLAMARGMLIMAKRNALVNRLQAVETLGSTNVLFVDKTGTLTENRMSVHRLELPGGRVDVDLGSPTPFEADGQSVDPSTRPEIAKALEIQTLCNNASLGSGEDEATGEPLEIALLEAAKAAGIDRQALLEAQPEVREEAFDASTKKMATVHEADQGYHVAIKGAPEEVIDRAAGTWSDEGRLPLTPDEKEAWLERNAAMARDGLRVIALATGQIQDPEDPVYEELTLLGLVGLLDPPRGDIAQAVAECHRAGIRVIMVTGDHPETAAYIARAVGITDQEDAPVVTGAQLPAPSEDGTLDADQLAANVFARVTPEQKLALIAHHQAAGNVVAMTGDGVNDAPALQRADIGVAMGQRGTQVAREASDVVLKDDAFPTIVAAVHQGRVIFNNIRRFILYLLSCNVSEIMVVGIAAALGGPLVLLPLQILFLNLVTDVFPALALGLGKGSDDVMGRPPRAPGEPFLRRDHWWSIAGWGALLSVFVLGAFALARTSLGFTTGQAVTVSFLTLAFAQLWHVFDMRDASASLTGNSITRNPYVWGALALCTALLLISAWFPPLALVLSIQAIGPIGWALVLSASLGPVAIGQAIKRFQRQGHPSGQQEPVPAGR